MKIFSKLLKINHNLRTTVPLNRRNKHFSFFLVLVATCCDNYSVGAGITTLYSVMEKFNTSTVMASWTLSSYSLTLASFIMFAGKLTDILGPEPVFISGIFLTGIFSLICACIEDQIIVLIVFRAIQGIFAAALIPSSFAVASSYYEGIYLGYALNALVVTLTAIFGIAMVTGGAFSLTDIGYRSAYFFVFAFATTIAIVLYFTMYPIPRTEDHKNLSLKYLDYPGAFLLVVGVLLVILGLTEGGESWKRSSSYAPLIVGVLVIIGAVLFEVIYITNFKQDVETKLQEVNDAKRCPSISKEIDRLKKEDDQAGSIESASSIEFELTQNWRYQVQLLLPREIFVIPSIIQYMCATFFLFIGFMTFLMIMTQYYQFVIQDSPLMTGLKILPNSLGMTIGSVVNQESIIYKIGMKYCMLFSQILLIAATVWASRHDFRTTNSFWAYDAFSQFLYGYAVNLYYSIYLNAVLRRTPIHLQGVVSGLLQTIAQVGITLGTSIVSSILGEVKMPTNFKEQLALQKQLMNPIYLVFACQAISFVFILFIKNQKSIGDSPEDKEVKQDEITEV